LLNQLVKNKEGSKPCCPFKTKERDMTKIAIETVEIFGTGVLQAEGVSTGVRLASFA